MRPDTLSVILRSASFIALFQAVGMTLFLAVFGRPLEASLAQLQRIARLSAIAAAALLMGQYALEAARMADDMSGVVDPALQRLVMESASSAVLGMRLLGLLLVATAVTRRSPAGRIMSFPGALIVAVSFALVGHTAANPLRVLLAPLLVIHVAIVAFWFGALPPLYFASTRERPDLAARITQSFSTVALWIVPGIAAAGISLACVLVRHPADLRSAYGLSLIAKFTGFSVLMGLAALNKWRLGPALGAGQARVLRLFRRSLGLEYALIAVVLSITAAMTMFYSPAP